MAFDFTKLTGYRDGMTAEEKLGLLNTYETPAPDLTGYIQKTAFDKTASELAEAKRQLKAKLTEDELKAAQQAESEAALKAELEALRKDKTISERKADYLGLGYDEALAADTAAAIASGDMAKVIANQKTFIENVRKAERASKLADDPAPAPGGGKHLTEKEQIEAKLASETKLEERVALIRKLSEMEK